jgi:hypothetical protein
VKSIPSTGTTLERHVFPSCFACSIRSGEEPTKLSRAGGRCDGEAHFSAFTHQVMKLSL